MRLLVFSDIHSDLQALEKLMAVEADTYIVAGDLVNWGRGLDLCGPIMQPRAGRVWVLPGNHETEDMVDGFCQRFGFHRFHGRSMRTGGYDVAGLGYSNPTPFNTPGEYSEAEIARRLDAFRNLERLVLVCHCPPYGSPLDRIRDGVHAGSTAVAEFVAARQPEHLLCGHIHEAAGAAAGLGRTHAVNVGKKGYLLELK